MPENKPDPKPGPNGPEIPVGKLVGGKPAKPAAVAKSAPAAKPRPTDPPAAAVPVVAVAAAPEFDVELVAVPCPPPQMPRKPRDQRSLFDLDRRDFIMLGAGVGGGLVAVLSGLVLAKILQRKPSDGSAANGEQ